MISNSADKDLTTKNGHTGADNKITARSRYWLGLKDPRIVRVSRAFGGKDRHSKVTTVKGLRDRRVRLSVQTAIQLYDLQEKLGLSQPSKVVDWLLSHSQHEIDKLPPLQMPPNFMHLAHTLATSEVPPPPPPQWQVGEKLKDESNAQIAENGSNQSAAAASHLLAPLSSARRLNLCTDQLVQDAMGFPKSAREAPATDHSIFERPINGGNSTQPALANLPFSRLTTNASLPGALGNLPYAASFYHLETVANALDQHHFGSRPSKLLEAAASNPNYMPSQLVFCASGGMPVFSSFLANAELSSKQYHIQVAAAASPNLQLGSVASHQSAGGGAVERPSPAASFAFRHHYPDC